MLDAEKGGQENNAKQSHIWGYRNVGKRQNIGEEDATITCNPHPLLLANLPLQNPQSSSSSLRSQLPGTLLCPLNLPAAVAAAAAPPAANIS